MKAMKPTNNLQELYNVKNIHMTEINRIRKQTQRLEWLISALVGASITLICIIAHMMITGPAWTW